MDAIKKRTRREQMVPGANPAPSVGPYAVYRENVIRFPARPHGKGRGASKCTHCEYFSEGGFYR